MDSQLFGPEMCDKFVNQPTGGAGEVLDVTSHYIHITKKLSAQQK